MIKKSWRSRGARLMRRCLLGGLLLALLSPMAIPAQAAGEKSSDTLKGISAMWVTVTGLSDEARQRGLSLEMLRTLVEKKVTSAGIKVVDSAQCRQLPGQPHLVVRVIDQRRNELDLYSMAVVVQLVQRVRLERSPKVMAMAETWGMTGVVSVGTSELSAVSNIILRYVDKFLGAHGQANQGNLSVPESEADLDTKASGGDN